MEPQPVDVNQQEEVTESEQSEDFSPRPGGTVRGKAPQYSQQPNPIGPSANQLPPPHFSGQVSNGPIYLKLRMINEAYVANEFGT